MHRGLGLQIQPKSGISSLFKALKTNYFHLPSIGDALRNRCPEGSRVSKLSWRHQKLHSYHLAGHARRLSCLVPSAGSGKLFSFAEKFQARIS